MKILKHFNSRLPVLFLSMVFAAAFNLAGCDHVPDGISSSATDYTPDHHYYNGYEYGDCLDCWIKEHQRDSIPKPAEPTKMAAMRASDLQKPVR